MYTRQLTRPSRGLRPTDMLFRAAGWLIALIGGAFLGGFFTSWGGVTFQHTFGLDPKPASEQSTAATENDAAHQPFSRASAGPLHKPDREKARRLLATGELDDALSLLRADDPNDPTVQIAFIETLFLRGVRDLGLAETHLERSTHPAVPYFRGELLALHGELADARIEFAKGLGGADRQTQQRCHAALDRLDAPKPVRSGKSR
jgi:hypothetical protein